MKNPRSQVHAVVFDMDGLMFNTEDIYDIVGQTLLNRRGMLFPHELKMKMMGLPDLQAVQVMKTYCGLDDEIHQLSSEMDQLFWELLPKRIAMLPGLTELLDHLEGHGVPKAVATSSRRKFAETALNRFDLWNRFEFVLTAEDVVHGKPAPDVYLLAAERLGISPSQMLVLEDSINGSQAAVAAGAITVAIPGPLCRSEDYPHVDYVVDRLDSEVILVVLNRNPQQ